MPSKIVVFSPWSDFLVNTLKSTIFIRLTSNLDIMCMMTNKPQKSSKFGDNQIQDGQLAAILKIWLGASDILVNTLESTIFIWLTSNLDILLCMTYEPWTSSNLVGIRSKMPNSRPFWIFDTFTIKRALEASLQPKISL